MGRYARGGPGAGKPPSAHRSHADPRHSPAKGRAETIEPHNLVSLCDRLVRGAFIDGVIYVALIPLSSVIMLHPREP